MRRRDRICTAAGLAAVLLASASAPGFAADDAAIGRALFRRAWVPAPSATRANDGLGPHFDARSCAACHPGGDRPAADAVRDGALPRGMVVRLARADGSADPLHGRQLQSEAVTGLAPEARVAIAVEGGEKRRFRIRVDEIGDGPLAADTTLSLRLAPSLFGAGAIEAVTEQAIRERADPDDRDGDGISGRLSEIVDRDGHVRVGRWGFRADAVDLVDQTAAAFSGDMGLSTKWRPDPFGDCTPRQASCRSAPAGSPDSAGDHEIDEAIVTRIAVFLSNLERPHRDRRPPSAASRRGGEIFRTIGCAACHAPLVGGGRTIHSDLLLHDMGPGLAGGDARREALREWRTTPLIGLGDRLAAGLPLLHDGRARTLAEAVAWHDGEAAAARRRFESLAPADLRAVHDHFADAGAD